MGLAFRDLFYIFGFWGHWGQLLGFWGHWGHLLVPTPPTPGSARVGRGHVLEMARIMRHFRLGSDIRY